MMAPRKKRWMWKTRSALCSCLMAFGWLFFLVPWCLFPLNRKVVSKSKRQNFFSFQHGEIGVQVLAAQCKENHLLSKIKMKHFFFFIIFFFLIRQYLPTYSTTHQFYSSLIHGYPSFYFFYIFPGLLKIFSDALSWGLVLCRSVAENKS